MNDIYSESLSSASSTESLIPSTSRRPHRNDYQPIDEPLRSCLCPSILIRFLSIVLYCIVWHKNSKKQHASFAHLLSLLIYLLFSQYLVSFIGNLLETALFANVHTFDFMRCKCARRKKIFYTQFPHSDLCAFFQFKYTIHMQQQCLLYT